MNTIHNLYCSSRWWSRRVKDELLPWGLEGVELGDDALEVGPGFGATTRQLSCTLGSGRLTAIELEEDYCRRLTSELGDAVKIVHGDATSLPFADNRFSAVLCFAMLHHIPLRDEQNQMFAETARVLRPGGVFAGTDSVGSDWRFKLIHIGDTLLPNEPGGLPPRLRNAGLAGPVIDVVDGMFRFRAYKPLA